MNQTQFFTDIAVHPAAAVFPMLSDDELRDLAEDIKANGQIHPIILDSDGVLIDGRNRFAACNLAGVEPDFETLPESVDPVAYILSSNINRRHMNKGQQAMAVARMCLLSKQPVRAIADMAGTSASRIAQANVVIQFAPELVDSVLVGSMSLNDAYEQARGRKGAASSMEAQMGRLRSEAPDLADLVTEERMTLREALAALDERISEERRQREVTKRLMDQALGFLGAGRMEPRELGGDIRRKLGHIEDARGLARDVSRAIATLETIRFEIDREL